MRVDKGEFEYAYVCTRAELAGIDTPSSPAKPIRVYRCTRCGRTTTNARKAQRHVFWRRFFEPVSDLVAKQDPRE